ncbi:LysR family transcriptional regulator [Pseudoteredinibacter isoporae]
MTLDDLKVFIAACEHKNLSAVARQMHCTQPAVSQHIVRLEKELGVGLLERKARGVEPTQAGQVFYEHVREGLGNITLGVRQLEQLAAGEMGSLGITTGGTTIKHFMSNTVVAFRERYPSVKLHFQSANTHQRCIEALRDEQVDLAFITMGDAIKGIEQRPFVEMPWVLVVPEHDKLAQRTRIQAKQLKDISYIALKDSSTSQSQLTQQLQSKGVYCQTITTVDDWDTAIQFVEMGLGHTISPERHAQNLKKQHAVAYIPISDLPPIVFGWASRRWKSLPKIAEDFVELFEETNQKR